MQVIATAGHVDHGKSALVRALTGMEPDRWAEERRRGMTIDIGFAWLTLPAGEQLAFVDVPGHERFVPNMLAGVGPVPGVLFVVAADEGWMPQSAEHLAVLDALDIRHGDAGRHPLRSGRPGARGWPRPERYRRDKPGHGRGGRGQRGHRRRARRSCSPRWPGWPRRCPRPIPARPCGSGWTARSASRQRHGGHRDAASRRRQARRRPSADALIQAGPGARDPVARPAGGQRQRRRQSRAQPARRGAWPAVRLARGRRWSGPGRGR